VADIRGKKAFRLAKIYYVGPALFFGIIAIAELIFAMAVLFRLDPGLDSPFLGAFLLLGSALFTALCFHYIGMRGHEVQVDDDGVTESRCGRSLTLAWSEIAEFKSRRLFQRLDLVGRDGAVLRLEFALEDFEGLLEVIRKHLPAPAEHGYPYRFGKAYFRVYRFALVGLIGFAVSRIPTDGWQWAVVWAAFSVYLMVGSYRSPEVSYLEVDRENIALKTFGRNWVYKLAQVESVDIESPPVTQPPNGLRTIIQMDDGNTFSVWGLVADPMLLVPLLE